MNSLISLANPMLKFSLFIINLEEDIQPLVGTIYSFSAPKQKDLKKFIEENLNMGFI